MLRFFNASPDEYAVVFTANASQALKLAAESYPFAPGDRLLLTFDNHNSVLGMREFARARGVQTEYVPILPPDMRLDETTLDRLLADRLITCSRTRRNPTSRGLQHPVQLIP